MRKIDKVILFTALVVIHNLSFGQGDTSKPKSGYELKEEVIKGEAAVKIQETKFFIVPPINPEALIDSVLGQKRYIFDEKLYATIDGLNTPILYLHSEYLRVPLVPNLVKGDLLLFLPRFEKAISSWELVITDSHGEVMRRFAGRSDPPPSIRWDGRKDNGSMVNPGEIYIYTFKAFDALQNETRLPGPSPIKINGIIYYEGRNWIASVSGDVIFTRGTANLNSGVGVYFDELANVVKENFKNEAVIYSYTESEQLSQARCEIIKNEIGKRVVLPPDGLKLAPRFVPGLEPKFSKIEIIIH
ncbi:MAG: hypothetical protein ABIL05_02005 [candidate division WOR-3 bacterium]